MLDPTRVVSIQYHQQRKSQDDSQFKRSEGKTVPLQCQHTQDVYEETLAKTWQCHFSKDSPCKFSLSHIFSATLLPNKVSLCYCNCPARLERKKEIKKSKVPNCMGKYSTSHESRAVVSKKQCKKNETKDPFRERERVRAFNANSKNLTYTPFQQ